MAKKTFLPEPAKPRYPGEGSPNRKNPPANYRKYNKEVHAKIVEACKDGNSYDTAGVLAGLGKQTIWDWLDKAKKRPEEFPEYVKLHADMTLARAACHDAIVARIKETALSGLPNTWQAGAWILERQDPVNWGRKDRVQVSGDRSAPLVQLNQVVLVDSNAREQGRAFLRGLTDGGTGVPVGSNVGHELKSGEGPAGQGSREPIEVEARKAR